LASKFGWSFEQIQESPAVWLDWLIKIDGISEEVKEKRSNPA
jgi:hypothetical protein